ncbi:CoA transferase [Williamsia sp. 1138]|uniref:CoA transferase n=1 Tax=Williamsia sp. 1138 TaxID=1903117 RepID=UPI000A1022D4|nr:CoA transferase [Williamsia sp. 1138]OZG26190.1 CoA transferase [Williamsia sp. 1138]
MTAPTRRWAESGLAHLTGEPDGPPDFSRSRILERADQAAAPFGVDAALLLAGRAGLTGTSRAGRTSVGGSTRLMRCRDTWCVFTLARPSDLAVIGALLETGEAIDDPWQLLADAAADREAAELVERGRLLGMPCAVLNSHGGEPVVSQQLWSARAPRPVDPGLLVVDLSAMWAGPLCGHLLRALGATVIKVESPDRADGARFGNADFFEWMNGGKLQFSAPVSRESPVLAALLDAADVVIEASRPRALEQAGLAAATRAPRPGRVWVRITGYGAGQDERDRVAFGDDAAAAGGLVGTGTQGPIFCGDAIADPLTGLEAAHAVLESLGRGGGEVLDVAMAGVAARYAAIPLAPVGSDAAVSAPPVPSIVRHPVKTVDAHWVRKLVDERSGLC